LKYLIATFWILLVCGLGYLPEQGDFLWIMLFIGPLFGLYILTYRVFKSHHDILFFVFLSIFLRMCLIFAFPNLSDDIYRFLWDGHLINDGVNPFLYTPREWMTIPHQEAPIYDLLFPHLNSPDYYSIYPPVCQAIFSICAKLSPESIYWAAVLMKIIFLVAEVTTIYFLLKLVQLMHIPQQRVLLYALNPLVLIEFSGNLHFEALMIMFLVMALWFYMRQRSKMFSISMALSIGSKLLPLMFLPFFIRRFRKKKLLIGLLLLVTTLVLLFVPFVNSELIHHLGDSVNLYFQKFEFNASIYYVLRWIGFQIRGYNMIHLFGPLLSILTLVSIVSLALLERPRKMQHVYKMLLFAFTIFLLCSTTIHPWYLGIPIMLSVLTRFRYPIFWSALIMCTYINYSGQEYHEYLTVVVIEYILVLFVILIEVFGINLVAILVKTMHKLKLLKN